MHSCDSDKKIASSCNKEYSHKSDDNEEHADVYALIDVADHHGEADEDDGCSYEAMGALLPHMRGCCIRLHCFYLYDSCSSIKIKIIITKF